MLKYAAHALIVVLFAAPASAYDPAAPSGDLRQRIEQHSTQLEQVIERYNELREDLKTTIAQTHVLKRQIQPLQQQMAQRRAAVGRLAAAGYRSHRVNPFNALFDAQSTHEVINRLLILETFAQRQQREIGALAMTSDRFQEAQRTLDALVGQQRLQHNDLVNQRIKIEMSIVELKELQARAGPVKRISSSNFKRPKLSGKAEKVISYALRQLGKNYKFAAEGPGGFDCSGLVKAAFRSVGLELPHHSRSQQQQAWSIGRKDLRPGDLIFYFKDLHHVAIYVGGGRMIHAPRAGEHVRIDPIDSMPVHSYGRLLAS